jgi:hypothetical protein
MQALGNGPARTFAATSYNGHLLRSTKCCARLIVAIFSPVRISRAVPENGHLSLCSSTKFHSELCRV